MIEQSKSVGIVIPLANESKTIFKLYNLIEDTISKYKKKFKIYFIVDKASKDNTRELCEEISKENERFITVWGENNKNAIDAYLLGYQIAYEAEHDFIIEMDGGLSHNPKEISNFLNLLDKGYECVFGCRFALGGQIKKSRVSRYFFSRTGTILSNFLLGMSFKDGTSGFIGFKRSAVKLLLAHGIKSKSHFYQTELRLIMKDLNWVETPITYQSPSASISSNSIKDSIYLLLFYTLKRFIKLLSGN